MLTLILATEKSGTGGRNVSVHSSSWTPWKRFACEGSQRYVSILHRVSTSLYFGVSPARMTLSEHAMHSMQSASSLHLKCLFYNNIIYSTHRFNTVNATVTTRHYLE
jgi:hypothetical protein